MSKLEYLLTAERTWKFGDIDQGGMKCFRPITFVLRLISLWLLDYLRAPPSPLACKPLPYDATTIKTLMERIRPYDLTKAEMLMIINHRPTSLNALTYIVEELELRYPDPAVHEEMLAIIAEVLGTPDEEAEGRTGKFGDQMDVDVSTGRA